MQFHETSIWIRKFNVLHGQMISKYIQSKDISQLSPGRRVKNGFLEFFGVSGAVDIYMHKILYHIQTTELLYTHLKYHIHLTILFFVGSANFLNSFQTGLQIMMPFADKRFPS